MASWLGVDVGGARKGFDCALVEERRLAGLWGGLDREAVADLVERARPEIVAIDSPCRCAPSGHTSREDERRLNQAVCGIRWTPDEREVGANPYYGWVVEGLCLYEALGRRGVPAIEVFPTASWTRWLGPRGNRSRAAWTTAGLAALPLDGLPVRSNQDVRDAIAAAVTARAHARGMTEAFGEIVVPLGGYFEGDVAGARRQDHGLHRGVQPA
jgi:predicted nuclease with RNAse H fold